MGIPSSINVVVVLCHILYFVIYYEMDYSHSGACIVLSFSKQRIVYTAHHQHDDARQCEQQHVVVRFHVPRILGATASSASPDT
jgi:hypothetical protein